MTIGGYVIVNMFVCLYFNSLNSLQQSEEKSGLGPWLVPMFGPDYLVTLASMLLLVFTETESLSQFTLKSRKLELTLSP